MTLCIAESTLFCSAAATTTLLCLELQICINICVLHHCYKLATYMYVCIYAYKCCRIPATGEHTIQRWLITFLLAYQ